MTRNMTFLSFKWSRCFAPRRPRPQLWRVADCMYVL